MNGHAYLSDLILVQQAGQRGRGVFALQDLPEGLLLEVAPVIVMSKADQELLDQTPLHDYIFLWGDDDAQCCMALGWVSLYNHAYEANCDYLMDFDQQTISIVTVSNIAAGAELFINYNGAWNDPKPVWIATVPPDGL